jgi:hypothetical protein
MDALDALPAGPPSWLWAALAAPHAWGLLPLLVPRRVAQLAAALGHADAATPYAAGALVLAAAQAGAVLQWLYDAHTGTPELSRTSEVALPLALRCALAAPLLAGGALLRIGAARVLGRGGLYFGRQLGGPERERPWATDWPFSVTGAASGGAVQHKHVL